MEWKACLECIWFSEGPCMLSSQYTNSVPKPVSFQTYVFPVLTNPCSWFSCCCIGTNPYSPPSSSYQPTNIGKQIRSNACFKDCPHHCQMKPSLCSHHNLKEGQHIIFVCVNSAYWLEEFVNTIIKPHISTYKTQILTRKHVINRNHLKNKWKLNYVTWAFFLHFSNNSSS